MTKLSRRRFLNLGLPATLGLGNSRIHWGLVDWPSALGGTGRVMASTADAAPSKNLIANGDFGARSPGSLPDNWSVVSGNPALRPRFNLVSVQNGENQLMAQGNGREQCYGYVRHAVRLTAGKSYRMRVRFRSLGLNDINRNLVHGVFTSDTKFNNGIFSYQKDGDWVVGQADFAGPSEDQESEVRLYFRYSARGKVWWNHVSLEEEQPLAPRPVTVALSWGGGDLKWWERWLDAAGTRGADIAVMPELFNGIVDPMKAERDDGPSRRLMAAKAHQWKMYVSGSSYVWRGDLVFNTAPLFDRQGRLVGVYDKNMVYEPELDLGATPGRGFPVFQTDVGTIGIMICYDSWFPQTAQLLALKGAELILFPNAGYYLDLMHARSADNGVFIAASSLNNAAGVWDCSGRQAGDDRPDPSCGGSAGVLRFEKDEDARLVVATLDLAKKVSPANWGGPMRSAPGGRRCRETCVAPLEDEIELEAKRWWTDHSRNA